jgi:hypothetical protein
MSNQEGPLDYSGHQPIQIPPLHDVNGNPVSVQTNAQGQPIVVQLQYPDPVSAGNHHAVKQGRDKAVYTRQQKGHSLILHLLLGMFVLWIPAIYISVSPNHYWHA